MVNIKVLPLGAYQTNCYIAWGENADTCIVIDPGYAPEQVLSEVDKLGKRIDAILLTHGHFDHVGAVKQIAADTDCLVYIHENDLSLPAVFTAGSLYYTDTYGEGTMLFTSGLGIQVLHTPGHTPGSVCLAVEDTLFSGDTLFAGSCGRTDLPGGSTAVILKSLKRLAGLDKNYTVYPGHGAATTLDEERRYNPYLQGRML